MKKAPHYEVPLSQSRFQRRHTESSSTPQKHKQEIARFDIDDRAERTQLAHLIHAPSAPSTDVELEHFTHETARVLSEALKQLEKERGVSC